MTDPIRHDDLKDPLTIRLAQGLTDDLDSYIQSEEPNVVLIATAMAFRDAAIAADVDVERAFEQILDAFPRGLN